MVIRPMLAAALTSALLVLPVFAQDITTLPQRFTATAVSLGEPRNTAGTGRVDILIERWSTPQERNALLTALKEQAGELLVRLHAQRPVGRISTPGNVGHELRYAAEERGADGGRRIFIATDRPVGFWEPGELAQYPFTFVELRLDARGHGEGKLAVAAQLNVAGNVIELVNYTLQPLALAQVRQESR